MADSVRERQIALVFKAFCDENRVRILKRLTRGETCACRLLEELQVSQPTLSHHMKILCASGLVTGRRDGKWTHYSICREGAALAAGYLLELTCSDGEAVPCACCDGGEACL